MHGSEHSPPVTRRQGNQRQSPARANACDQKSGSRSSDGPPFRAGRTGGGGLYLQSAAAAVSALNLNKIASEEGGTTKADTNSAA